MESRKRKLIELEVKKEITESVRSTFECWDCGAFPDLKTEDRCRNDHVIGKDCDWEKKLLKVCTYSRTIFLEWISIRPTS